MGRRKKDRVTGLEFFRIKGNGKGQVASKKFLLLSPRTWYRSFTSLKNIRSGVSSNVEGTPDLSELQLVVF